MIFSKLSPFLFTNRSLFSLHLVNRQRSSLSPQVRVRFAPSPTGKLHIGGIRTAFYNYLFARKYKGTFILRIEDTDQERFKQGSVDFLLESLKWANITADYGPHLKSSLDQEQGAPWQQSERLNLYKEYSEQLLKSKKAYRCFCNEARLELLRREASRRQEKISYDGRCRHLDEETVQKYLDEGRPSVVRFHLDDRDIVFNDLTVGVHSSNPGKNEGDFIIIKSDGFPTYHFAHVVDDHLMRITHVLRGQEWLLSTPKHIALFEAFGWTYPQYGHLPLICNSDGTKISKRQNDIHVLSYRDRGYFAETILVYLSSIGGGLSSNVQDSESFFPNSQAVLPTLVDLFDETKISNKSVKLNQDLLDRLNRRFIELKLKDDTESQNLINQLGQLLIEKYSSLPERYLEDNYLRTVLKWSLDRIFKLNDLVTDTSFSFLWTDMSSLLSSKEINSQTRLQMLELIENIEAHLKKDLPLFFTDKNHFKKEMSLIFKQTKLESKVQADKKVNYWQMIRFILTGNEQGPPVFEIFSLLEKENILYRLTIAKRICSP